MRTLALTRPVTVTLDGSGNGTAAIGPTSPGEIWYPESVRISSTGNPPAGLATCTIYCGSSPIPVAFVDATYNVLGAASSLISGQKLHPGQQVFAVWSGANAGASATLIVSGRRQVP